jgi:hypothetical protein
MEVFLLCVFPYLCCGPFSRYSTNCSSDMKGSMNSISDQVMIMFFFPFSKNLLMDISNQRKFDLIIFVTIISTLLKDHFYIFI